MPQKKIQKQEGLYLSDFTKERGTEKELEATLKRMGCAVFMDFADLAVKSKILD